MPNSTTAMRWWARRFNSVNGTPMSLFKLPWVDKAASPAWARKIEAVMSRALFPEGSGLEIELDLSSFLRGDPQTRWAAHKIAVDAGILDADEIREIEGFNPRRAVTEVLA